MSREIKACPFCGGEAVKASHHRGYPGAWENHQDHWIYCDAADCFAHVGMCETEEEAITAWNRRAGEGE